MVISPSSITFCGFGRRASCIAIFPPNSGRKARSIAATSTGSIPPDHQTTSRPASQSDANRLRNAPRADFSPVQPGTAVRKNPPRTAQA
jgi:hypothetical protein